MQEQSCGHFHFQAWIPLANKSSSAQNLFADFARCDKSADQVDSTLAMSSQLAAMRYTKPRTHAQYVYYFSNGSIIPSGFKFTELHTLTLAARSYALLPILNVVRP